MQFLKEFYGRKRKNIFMKKELHKRIISFIKSLQQLALAIFLFIAKEYSLQT